MKIAISSLEEKIEMDRSEFFFISSSQNIYGLEMLLVFNFNFILSKTSRSIGLNSRIIYYEFYKSKV